MRNTLKSLVGAMCCTTIFGNYGYSVESSELKTPNYVHDNEANINMSIEELYNYINNAGNIQIRCGSELMNFATAFSIAKPNSITKPNPDYGRFFDNKYFTECAIIESILQETYSKYDIIQLSNSLLNEHILFYNKYGKTRNEKTSEVFQDAWEKLIYYTLVNNMTEEYNKLCNLSEEFLTNLGINIDIASVKMQANKYLNVNNINHLNNNMSNKNTEKYISQELKDLTDKIRNNNTSSRCEDTITRKTAYDKYPTLKKITDFETIYFVQDNYQVSEQEYSRKHFVPEDIDSLLQENISFFNEYNIKNNSEVLSTFAEAWHRILYAVYDKQNGKSTKEIYNRVAKLVLYFLPKIGITITDIYTSKWHPK